MVAIDLDAIDSAPPNLDPFEHLIAPRVIKNDALPMILADFPKIEKPGSHPVNKKISGSNFISLIKELRSQAFSELIGNKLGIKLTSQPIIITIRGQCQLSDGKIHTDSKDKLVTALVYLNASWNKSGGKLRLLKNNHNLDDYIADIPPDAGSLVAFICRPNAWHGHHKFEGKRQTIQINWVRSHKYKLREQIRHTLTANLKKLIGWI